MGTGRQYDEIHGGDASFSRQERAGKPAMTVKESFIPLKPV